MFVVDAFSVGTSETWKWAVLTGMLCITVIAQRPRTALCWRLWPPHHLTPYYFAVKHPPVHSFAPFLVQTARVGASLKHSACEVVKEKHHIGPVVSNVPPRSTNSRRDACWSERTGCRGSCCGYIKYQLVVPTDPCDTACLIWRWSQSGEVAECYGSIELISLQWMCVLFYSCIQIFSHRWSHTAPHLKNTVKPFLLCPYLFIEKAFRNSARAFTGQRSATMKKQISAQWWLTYSQISFRSNPSTYCTSKAFDGGALQAGRARVFWHLAVNGKKVCRELTGKRSGGMRCRK